MKDRALNFLVIEHEIETERIIIKMNYLFILLELAIRLRLLRDLIFDIVIYMNLKAYIKFFHERFDAFLLPRIDKHLFEIV